MGCGGRVGGAGESSRVLTTVAGLAGGCSEVVLGCDVVDDECGTAP